MLSFTFKKQNSKNISEYSLSSNQGCKKVNFAENFEKLKISVLIVSSMNNI